ncbi:MAG: ATP-binding protein [Syntrophomonas sp.]|uniref:sensor histidine kinase n=1 Tax=Syntrophomonas sp. TaxID=2053627 RepID=UPI00262554F8|nr:ATP-binding protein [Syntrophomonas sp.]MDD2511360.1 ATP-binding protein [Syntrophomonas sp.]MDD3879654.1 ATP-binding protein [Syntrophomonas sp.]MDD4627424.1 ATP-binding protein [Syntrophomonas sp.]
MFAKLRRKFVIINMSLLTVVFLVIFSVIYLLTVVSGERQTEFALNTIMFAPPRPFPDNPVLASSMVAELDEKGHIVKSFSFINMSQQVISQAVEQAVQNRDLSGKIRIEESYYAFLKHNTGSGTRIVFVDRTPQHRMLMNLLLTFLLVGGISLLLLFLISIYLADKSIQPIQEAFEKQRQFIADASHELRTPLAVIKTNLALITANSEESVKSQSRWIDYISSQTDTMASLVDDMLALARIDYMEAKPLFTRFDLSQTLSSTLLAFEAIFYEKHISLKQEIQEDVFLNGEKENIKKVISILIDNAIKNTGANGSITVRLASDKNKIEMRISNTGEGIPAEDLQKIFERFYQVDKSRSRENRGYGLGLAIAKSIVEQQQGRIYATSTSGADTSFVVEWLKK